MTAFFNFRDLKTTAEFAEFAKKYMDSFHGKQLSPIQALHAETLSKYKRVIGVYQGSRLVAGYIINSYPHRCFEYVTEQERANIIESLGGKNQICEVAAIWKTSSISRLVFSLKIWSRITIDVLKEKRPVIFGCSYAGHGMIKRYSMLSPTIVRQGTHKNDLTVFYFRQIPMVLAYLASIIMIVPYELFRKLLKSLSSRKTIIND